MRYLILFSLLIFSTGCAKENIVDMFNVGDCLAMKDELVRIIKKGKYSFVVINRVSGYEAVLFGVDKSKPVRVDCWEMPNDRFLGEKS